MFRPVAEGYDILPYIPRSRVIGETYGGSHRWELVVFLAGSPTRLAYRSDEVVHSLGRGSPVAGKLNKGFTCVVPVEAYSLVGVEREISV